jgi:DNA polymerase I
MQIEPRVLAHFTEDESLIGAYVNGRDLYVEMAMKVFGFEEKYCLDKAKSPDGTFEPRKAVKSVLLGIMYGMGSKTLSQNLGMQEEQAKQIIADFFKAYPKVEKWIEERIAFAEENQYIETMFGRKRRFPGFKAVAKRYHAVAKKVMDLLGELPDFIWNEKYKYAVPYDIKREYWDMGKEYAIVKRRVINTIIQGSAADIMKLAMIEVAKLSRKKGWKMLATIHDEILLEVPATISEAEVNEIEKAMLGVVNLKTPMKVDVAFMYRWGEETSKDKWFKAA